MLALFVASREKTFCTSRLSDDNAKCLRKLIANCRGKDLVPLPSPGDHVCAIPLATSYAVLALLLPAQYAERGEFVSECARTHLRLMYLVLQSLYGRSFVPELSPNVVVTGFLRYVSLLFSDTEIEISALLPEYQTDMPISRNPAVFNFISETFYCPNDEICGEIAPPAFPVAAQVLREEYRIYQTGPTVALLVLNYVHVLLRYYCEAARLKQYDAIIPALIPDLREPVGLGNYLGADIVVQPFQDSGEARGPGSTALPLSRVSADALIEASKPPSVCALRDEQLQTTMLSYGHISFSLLGDVSATCWYQSSNAAYATPGTATSAQTSSVCAFCAAEPTRNAIQSALITNIEAIRELLGDSSFGLLRERPSCVRAVRITFSPAVACQVVQNIADLSLRAEGAEGGPSDGKEYPDDMSANPFMRVGELALQKRGVYTISPGTVIRYIGDRVIVIGRDGPEVSWFSLEMLRMFGSWVVNVG